MEKRINVDNVSKVFDRSRRKDDGALSFLLKMIYGNQTAQHHYVIKDISFSVGQGEKLGIIGRNGSGKSTLLKMIAGIYECTEGAVSTSGRLVYLNNFRHGLKLRLSMRDNIFLVGAIMGLSQKEIRNKLDEIVDFSGLRDHLHTKVFQFSSGMLGRLSFSISIHCLNHKRPDILLLDEVFGAGGDLDFNNRAGLKMNEFIRSGSAVVMAGHDFDHIEQHCQKVIWLENGQIARMGTPNEVIEHYKNSFKKN